MICCVGEALQSLTALISNVMDWLSAGKSAFKGIWPNCSVAPEKFPPVQAGIVQSIEDHCCLYVIYHFAVNIERFHLYIPTYSLFVHIDN